MVSESRRDGLLLLLLLGSVIINLDLVSSYDQLRNKNGQPQTSSGSSDIIFDVSNIQCNDENSQLVCPVAKESGIVCSGHGECNCSHGFCKCIPDWAGSSCEYHVSTLTCESLRSCVQCKAHGTGPFADDNGCEYFCRSFPRVISVNQFYVESHDTVCSFIDGKCRYLFKVANFPSLNDRNEIRGNADVYVIAKLKMDCDNPDNLNNFPPVKNERKVVGDDGNTMVSSHQVMEHIRDEEKQQSTLGGFAITPIILMLFIVLPTAACVLSFIFNVPSLPCGLCNTFRRPSSAYLRNLRPYPGSVEDNIIMNDL